MSGLYMDLYFKVFLGSAILAVLCIIVEVAAVSGLQDSSADYIYSLQKDRNKASEYFFIIVSQGTEYVAMVIGFVYYLISRSKDALMCIYVTFFATWLGDVLKMVIAHPRPFWYDSRIDAILCSKDYGSPSGHAGTVGALIIFFYWINLKKNLIVSTSIAAVSLGLLALDRNYLGLHFYFQVIFGYSIAFFIVSLVKLPKFWNLVDLTSSNLKKNLMFQSILLLLLSLGLLIFFIRDPELKEDWKENYKDQCSNTLTKQKALFSSLLESSSLMIAAGINLGCYLNKHKMEDGWKYKVSSIVILIIGGVIEQVCESFIKTLTQGASFSLFCILRYLIGVYIAAFIPFSLSCCFNKNLDNEQINLSVVK